MRILQPLWMAGVSLCLLLTACSPAAPTALPVTPSSPTLTPTNLPPATSTLTSEPSGLGVPAFQFLNDRSELVVISPETGQQLDSFKPIPFRDFYNYAFAPDGRTLALVADSGLTLIDLPSWKTREYDLGLHRWMSSVIYNSGGSLIAIASGEPESNMWIIDPQSGKVTANQKTDFSIRKLKFTADGKALMAYGPHIASSGVAANAGISVGSPKAALYSVPDVALLWSTQLDGVRDGTFPKKSDSTITQDIYQPGAAWHYEPGSVFSPTDNILYLVHGDEDKLTTVDFTNRKVHTMNVQAKTNWLDQLMALTAGVAYAKGMDGTVKQAFISPNGKFLFVGGNTEKVTMPTDTSELNITDTPIGLQVIDAKDGTLVSKMDDGTTPTGLSSDGRYLFLTNWNNGGNGAPKSDVYDIASMSIIRHLDNVYLTPTRSIDGTPILASVEYTGTNGDNICDLTIVDPATWIISNQWKRGCVGLLTTP